MKKPTCLLLIAALLLCGCDAPSADTTAVENTAGASESVGNTTDEVTDKTLTYEENLSEVYRKTADISLPIGGFLTPTDMNLTKPAFEKLLDGGINFMVTNNEFYGTVLLSNTLRVADETGMELCVWTFGPQVFTKEQIVEKLKLCLEHQSVKSLYLQDEPLPAVFGTLGKLKTLIKSELGAYMDWQIGSNMFPDGVFDDWYSTIDKYMSSAEPDFLCFDNYPWASGGNNFDNYYGNLGEAKLLADKYGVDLWTFLQTSAVDRLPNEAELRYQTNASLAMGADRLVCFTVWGAMFTDDGQTTNMYDSAKAVFSDIHAMKGVYLPYTNRGVIVTSDSRVSSALDSMSPGVRIEDTAYGALSSVTANKAVIGCFDDGAGKEAFYAVNSDVNAAGTVALTFDSAHTYQLWGEGGLEALGQGDSVTLELSAGDGKFIMLDTENDASKYEEPTPAQPVDKPVFVTAADNALVFELGFTSDGKVSNKLENSVTTRGFSGGNYTTVDGVNCLTGYDIYTCDTKNVLKDGVTVELYIKFDAAADKKWVTLFRDPNSNLNFYRLCDSAHRKTGDMFYFGVPDGDDVVIVGDINETLPNSEWLHIVAVQSKAGQYVYVNGKQVAQGNFKYTPTDFSTFFFSDEYEVTYLNTARIYTYAASAQQAADMYSAFTPQG